MGYGLSVKLYELLKLAHTVKETCVPVSSFRKCVWSRLSVALSQSNELSHAHEVLHSVYRGALGVSHRVRVTASVLKDMLLHNLAAKVCHSLPRNCGVAC